LATHRAGGWVDREDGEGWVLDDAQPPPAPEPVEHQPLKPTMEAAGGWRLVSEPPPPETEPEPDAEAEEASQPSDADVRAWAKANGIDVPARGRLSKDVVDQYRNRET